MDFGLNKLANVASLAPLKSTFGFKQLPGLNNSNLLPSLNWIPGSPPTAIMNSLANFNDKENDKEGDKEKTGNAERVQVFKKNCNTMTLEKCKLSRHQESAQKSKDPWKLVTWSSICVILQKC